MNNHRTDRQHTKGFYLVVSAPSGTGKTSICRQVLRMFPNLCFSVSYTTRPPRPGEVDGRDYHFIPEASFREGIVRGQFIEWAENYGNLYGTSVEMMDKCLNQGIDVMLDVEPRGAKALKEKYPEGVFVFILPPTLDELRARLNRRGFERSEVIEKRFIKAVDEIKEAFWYDYLIFNDKLDIAVDQLRSIYVAETVRRARLGNKLQAFLDRENS